MTNVVNLRAEEIRQGIEALRAGNDAGTVVRAIETMLLSDLADNTFVELLNEDGDVEKLTVDHRDRVYHACARATAVIAREYDPEHLGEDAEIRYHLQYDDYGKFTAAWEIADKLKPVFRDNDPGKVIGRCMDAIFDRSRLEDPMLAVYLRHPTQPDTRALVAAVLSWVERSRSLPDPEGVICQFLADKLLLKDKFAPEEALLVLSAALNARQALVTTLFNTVSHRLLDFRGSDNDRVAEAFGGMTLDAVAALGLASRYGGTDDLELPLPAKPAVLDDLVEDAWQALGKR